MVQTITTKSPRPLAQVATGRYLDTGTVAAYTFVLGFKPRYVKVDNITSRDGLEWFEGMADAHALKTVAAGTRTAITSNGITPTEDGFTLGLDTDVNVTSEQVSFVAIA
jgi:hypothetical protein